MDYELIDQCAERMRKDDNKLRDELVSLCIPYLLHIRIKWGFQSIPVKEVKDELVSDAIAEAFIKQTKGSLRFSLRLRNTFRDLCRARVKILRQERNIDIADACGISPPSSAFRGNTQPGSPNAEPDQNEKIRLVKEILQNHDPFSKKVVYEKVRGSTYAEMADIFGTLWVECKRVYWRDLYHLRKKLNKKFRHRPS